MSAKSLKNSYKQISYSSPYLTNEEIEAVVSVLNTNALSQGPVVDTFEQRSQSVFGAKYALACNSGTAALHMAYSALGVSPSAGVITSPITFLSTANAAKFCGAPVHFADVDPITGLVTLEKIKKSVEEASFPVRVIAPVHLGGQVCEMEAIRNYANSIGAFIVEDACHAPLAMYTDAEKKVFMVGACHHSDVATFSLHAIKHITTGEGGLLLTNCNDILRKSKLLRSHGLTRDSKEFKNPLEGQSPHYYEMQSLGWNYRISDINCALAITQLEKLKKNITRRQKIAERYINKLIDLPHVELPNVSFENGCSNAWHLFILLIDFEKLGKSRAHLMSQLKEQGIETQVHYIPLYKQPYYQNSMKGYSFPGAEAYYERCLSIPMYFGLSDDEIDYICQKLHELIV